VRCSRRVIVATGLPLVQSWHPPKKTTKKSSPPFFATSTSNTDSPDDNDGPWVEGCVTLLSL
jgi:hypothetical protein